MDAFASAAEALEGYNSSNAETNPFRAFEPFDCAMPSDDILAKAEEDDAHLLGGEIVALAGEYPRPFQTGFINSTKKVAVAQAGTKVGKPLDENTLVACERGAMRIGDANVGDMVFGSDGELYPVTGVHKQKSNRCYRFVFSDESDCVSSSDHVWSVIKFKQRATNTWEHGKIHSNNNFRKVSELTTEKIVAMCGIGKVDSNKRFVLPRRSAMQWPERKHIIPPYSMGALLGDGGLAHAVVMTCCDADCQIVERMADELSSVATIRKSKDKYAYQIGAHGHGNQFTGRTELYKELHRLEIAGKLSGDKCIHEEYKHDSVENRLSLLRGLMDTDGNVSRGCIVEFYSVSQALAEDVQWLARSLGGKAKISVKSAHYLKDGERIYCQDCYRVRIVIHEYNPFWLNRKADAWRPASKNRDLVIRRIEDAGHRKTACITIDAEDHLFQLYNGVVTHNSVCPIILLATSISHVIPYALRFDEGIDSGVPRMISPDNIRRWGRLDSRTGALIDHDWHVPPDPKAWNCGNIHGVGKFPTTGGKFGTGMLAPPGSQMWIGTLAASIPTFWWPKLAGGDSERLFPKEFVDTSRGNRGYKHTDPKSLFAINDCMIHMKTYHGPVPHLNFESGRAFILVFDEEPANAKIWRSGREHCEFLRVCFTPLKGLTWSKQVIFKNERNLDFFHASQYDSPYKDNEEVDAARDTFHSWDRQTVIWGLYSEQTGTPYYGAEGRNKLNVWMREKVYEPELLKFRPTRQYHKIVSMPEITHLPGLLDVGIAKSRAVEDNRQDVVKVYEGVIKGCPYVAGVDCAEGSIDPDDAQDRNCAIITRPNAWTTEGHAIDDGLPPVVVATIRSTLQAVVFARVLSYLLRQYNNALLAGERGIGKENEVVGQQLDDWPWWFMHEVENNKTKLMTAKKGFQTRSKSRDYIFELIRIWLDNYEPHEDPMLKDESLMKELAAAILGKATGGKVRCDHPKGGTLDMGIAFGISLYVYDKCLHQVVCNASKPESENQGIMQMLMQQRQRSEKPTAFGVGFSEFER